MIRYGLKLWTTNTERRFAEAARLHAEKKADFVELYIHPDQPFDAAKYSRLSAVPVTIHNAHSHGWHEFALGERQLDMWRTTIAAADFFHSDIIVIHPGQSPDVPFFRANLAKIDDPRIYIENMAGIDMYGSNLYASTLLALRELRQIHPICFDIEKAVKGAAYQGLPYQVFIDECLRELTPTYFHISGGRAESPVDEHGNLWDATFDVGWIRDRLEAMAKDLTVYLVFETPVTGEDFENALRNMDFFRRA